MNVSATDTAKVYIPAQALSPMVPSAQAIAMTLATVPPAAVPQTPAPSAPSSSQSTSTHVDVYA